MRNLGHYALERELGRGGMGQVFLARDTRLGRQVALKILRPELAARADLATRFEREARAAAALSHPGIVTVYSLERDGDVQFITMEHVDGQPLARLIGGEPLPVPRLMKIARRLADAVGAAHDAGIVHRDLKPTNVMVVDDHVVKVLDFGLARFTEPASIDPDAPTGASELTREGAVLGTIGYMSPEQLMGQRLDSRSDVFSLGIILYQLASGAHPFPGPSAHAVTAAILRDQPEPLDGRRDDLPPELATALGRCLEKDPQARYASATELAAALAAPQPSEPTGRLTPLPPAPVGHVPAERDAFVGRTSELTALDEMLGGGARLVTILGPGGTGKTRLVQHYGRSQLGRWPGGIWFCDLTESRSLDGLVGAVARALDVPLGAGDPCELLGSAIAGHGRCLLVLDNFEQIVELADQTVGRWLAQAAEAHVIVTSRIRLDLPGEHDFTLEPLPVTSDGVELFELRARARKPQFAVSDVNRGVVTELVQLLDSMPLAIELAASRIRVLSVEAIRARLEDRFKLLVGGHRGSRQETLATTIDWSWDMLEPWEQAALAQASVFEGGFTLEAAEAVIDLDPWDDAPNALDVVQTLVDKSLLRATSPADESDAAAIDVEPRFGMLVSIQEYAVRKLRTPDAIAGGTSGPGAERAAQARHETYYTKLGSDEASRRLGGRDDLRRSRALEAELDNLIAACRRAVARGDSPTALSLARAAERVLRRKGPISTGVELLDSVLAMPTLTALDRGRAHLVLGGATSALGQDRSAITHYETALELLGETGVAEVRHARAALGSSLRVIDRLPEAEEHLTAALELHREAGDRAGEADTLKGLGQAAIRSARPELARDHLAAALAIQRELGDVQGEARVLLGLAQLSHQLGDLERARRHYSECAANWREAGDRVNEAVALGNLGLLLIELGRSDEAEPRLRLALERHRQTGFLRGQSYWLDALSFLARERGSLDEARDLAEEAIRRAANWPNMQAVYWTSLAKVHLAGGDVRAARGAIDEALALEPAHLMKLTVIICLIAVQRAEGDTAASLRTLAAAEALAEQYDLPAGSFVARDLEAARQASRPS